MRNIIFILIFIIFVAPQVHCDNYELIKPYLKSYDLTHLEYDLLNVNMRWHDSFEGSDNYVNSSSISFDYKRMLFYCGMRVQAKRAYDDLEPFFSQSEWRQKAILQEPIDHMIALLSPSFPEIIDNPQLLLVEYYFYGAGSPAIIARYEKGKLELLE
jgi:hypothetical protein